MSNTPISSLRQPITRLPIDRSTLPAWRNAGHSVILRGTPNTDIVQLPSITPATTFSFGIWFKMLTNPNSGQRFISCRSLTTGGFELTENALTQKISFTGYNSSGSATVSINPTNTFSLGTWVHAAVVCSPNNTTLYLNGASIGTDVTHSLASPTGQIMTIGRSSFTTGSYLNANVTGFVFANNVTWSGAQVTALYTGTIPATLTCNIGFYEFVGSRCYDISGNNNHGVLTGLTSHYSRFSDTPSGLPSIGRYTFS